MDAREVGYLLRAEAAVEAAKNAECPQKGRLAFDAERWFLGKLSRAFREKPLAVGAFVNVGSQETFDAFASSLEQAQLTRAGSAERTIQVAGASEAGPSDTAGELADMAGTGGEGLGQDQNRG